MATAACLALLLASITTGCGYRSLGAASPTGRDGEAQATVAVVALRNDSPEPWIDRVVTDALRRELGLRGALRLEADPKRADYVLRGRVLPLDLRSNSFSSFVVALEYQVTLRLELELLRKEGDVIRLPARALSESDVYLASQDIEVTRTNRLEALRHLSDVLATRIVDRVEFLSAPRAEPTTAPAGGTGG
ncbi:MAG: LPS assembly lipoprotein LptE [bacterium]|nr:LPS assembly lipoprotein LptE [bacterium]